MIRKIDMNEFVEEFERFDRLGTFTIEAMEEMFKYYERQYKEFTIDVKKFWGEWVEYKNIDVLLEVERIETDEDYEKFLDSDFVIELNNGGYLVNIKM